MRVKTSLNTLTDWIKENVSPDNQETFNEQLRKRGCSQEEFATPLSELFGMNPRLLLNSLYETLIHHDSRDPETARTILQSLSDQAEIVERESPALAHFIWVGPPGSGAELNGVRSLSKSKPNQRIKFWVLEEQVAGYKEKLTNLPNVTVVSIETYAKKIGVSFNTTDTLESEIDKFKRHAEERMKSENAEVKTSGIRDRVTIVDYIKSVIPLYEGGWVFDADIMFLPSDTDKNELDKPKEWRFPFIKAYDMPDVWCYYRDRALDWKIDKNKGGAFLKETRSTPAWQMYLYLYYVTVSYSEQPSLSWERRISYLGGGILTMTRSFKENCNWFLCADGVVEKTLFSDDPYRNLAVEWVGDEGVKSALDNQAKRLEVENAVQQPLSKKQGFLADYFLYDLRYKESSATGSEFHLIKRMNKSYLGIKNLPMQFSYLFLPPETFKQIASLLHEFGVADELWKPYSGVLPLQKEYAENLELCVISLTPLHFSAFIPDSQFETILTIIPEENLGTLCFNEVTIPIELMPMVNVFSKFSEEDFDSLKKLVKQDAEFFLKSSSVEQWKFYNAIMNNDKNSVYDYDEFMALSHFLEKKDNAALKDKLISIDPYIPNTVLFPGEPEYKSGVLKEKLKSNQGAIIKTMLGDKLFEKVTNQAVKKDQKYFNYELHLLKRTPPFDYSFSQLQDGKRNYKMTLLELLAKTDQNRLHETIKKLCHNKESFIKQYPLLLNDLLLQGRSTETIKLMLTPEILEIIGWNQEKDLSECALDPVVKKIIIEQMNAKQENRQRDSVSSEIKNDINALSENRAGFFHNAASAASSTAAEQKNEKSSKKY